MRFLERVLLLAFILLVSLQLSLSKPRHRHKKHHKHDEPVTKSAAEDFVPNTDEYKIPNAMRRKFRQWTVNNFNVTTYYDSIEAKMSHVKDDEYLLSGEFGKSKSNAITTRVWMEFPNITKGTRLQQKRYLLDVTPVVGSREMNALDDCSTETVIGRPRFPENILEMRFDFTSLYASCETKGDPSQLKFKVRLYCLAETCDIELGKDEVNIFFFFHHQAGDDEDMTRLHFTSPAVPPIHFGSVTNKKDRRVPQLRMMQPRMKGERICGVSDQEFDFTKTGWRDWVIAPLVFKPNQCTGRCDFPIASHLDATNHAILKAIASSMYADVNCPSCVPNKLTSQTLLVHENGKAHVKVIQDMVVRSCRCA